jgi:hypothetical protein
LAPDDIARLAVRATDDHVIKLCYSALCEHRHYGNDKYLQVASRKLALDGLMIEPAC